jgi:glycosyltransferase involved in cell wall biosynthesis
VAPIIRFGIVNMAGPPLSCKCRRARRERFAPQPVDAAIPIPACRPHLRSHGTDEEELIEDLGVSESRATVIPFGINNAVPNTLLIPSEAKRRLGISKEDRTILFFGNIAPYESLEYLIGAYRNALAVKNDYRLIIAGRPKNYDEYWRGIREALRDDVEAGRVLLRADYIPNDETEVHFKAADVLVLPYKHIYQSGVLSFGLPVLAADVGSLSWRSSRVRRD